jgi:hypothetical protein
VIKVVADTQQGATVFFARSTDCLSAKIQERAPRPVIINKIASISDGLESLTLEGLPKEAFTIDIKTKPYTMNFWADVTLVTQPTLMLDYVAKYEGNAAKIGQDLKKDDLAELTVLGPEGSFTQLVRIISYDGQNLYVEGPHGALWVPSDWTVTKINLDPSISKDSVTRNLTIAMKSIGKVMNEHNLSPATAFFDSYYDFSPEHTEQQFAKFSQKLIGKANNMKHKAAKTAFLTHGEERWLPSAGKRKAHVTAEKKLNKSIASDLLPSDDEDLPLTKRKLVKSRNASASSSTHPVPV